MAKRWLMIVVLLLLVVFVATALYAAGQVNSMDEKSGKVSLDLGKGFSFWAEAPSFDKGALGGTILQGVKTYKDSEINIWVVYYLGKNSEGTGHLRVKNIDLIGNNEDNKDIVFTAVKGNKMRLVANRALVTFVVKDVSDMGISVALLDVSPAMELPSE